ncbi:MAG TPA: hypothetical protein VG455_10175, partial [Acidimicrobiales bacterium]|nr:hypothetical protein [Acidimicrobiales bacterium]
LELSGRAVTVVASVGAGQLRVVAPPDVGLRVDARATLGAVDVLDRTWEGIGPKGRVVEAGREGAGRLVLRLRVGVGQVEVRRAPA